MRKSGKAPAVEANERSSTPLAMRTREARVLASPLFVEHYSIAKLPFTRLPVTL
jgi:hypothetical protein